MNQELIYSACFRELRKIAQAPQPPAIPTAPAAPAPPTPAGADGHWRRLPEGHKGKGPGGAPQVGRTWVRKSRLKKFFKPYQHQKQFISAVQALPEKGGIIAAHGTGTGKTISAIAAFENLKEKGKARRALVIAPAGLRNNFLKKGIEKFTDSKGVVISGAGKDPGEDTEYIITSYAAFRRDPDKFIDTYNPDVIIADEFHRATNPEGKTHRALLHARTRVPKFMGLTASIVQNAPQDLAPLMRIASGEEGVGTKKEFRKRYTRRVSTGERGVFGGKTKETRLQRQEELVKKIGPGVHYLEDLDADKKPTKVTERIATPMSKDQVNLYRQAMKGVDPKIQAKIAAGQAVTQKEMAGLFTRLLYARQVSNSLHGHVPNMTLEEAADATPKIKRILDDAASHIKDTPDAQVIMYTNIVKGGVDVLTTGLRKRGISHGIFIGKGNKGVTEESRQQAVTDYLAGKIKVIVITGAGAEGLDLGNTTMVQLADGHYNPERIAQAEARGIRAKGLAHRPKKDRKVQVKQYVSTIPRGFFKKLFFRPQERSVGEFVYRTAEKKQRVNKQIRELLARSSGHEQKKRDSFFYRHFGGGP